jgi:hypothetical protein
MSSDRFGLKDLPGTKRANGVGASGLSTRFSRWVSNKMDEHPEVTQPAHRFSEDARDLAYQAVDALQEGTQRVQAKTSKLVKQGVNYGRARPMETVVIVGLLGVGLYALGRYIESRRKWYNRY